MKKLFILSIFLSIVLRLPWTIIPIMMPDEAIMLTVAGQISHDGAIYAKDFMDTRGPGGYYLTGLISYVFGYGNTFAFRIVSIITQIIILFLIRLLGRLIFSEAIADAACLIFAVFSYGYILHNTVAFNVEFMALPFLLGSAIFFYRALLQSRNESKATSILVKFFLAGVFCAITFAFKQVLAGFLGIYFFMLFLSYWNKDLRLLPAIRNIVITSIGFLVGFLLIFGPSLLTVGWQDTVYWLALFGGKYSIPNSFTKIFNFSARVLVLFLAQPLLWGLTLVWLGEFIFSYKNLSGIEKQGRIFVTLMLVIQWLGSIIAGSGQGHHHYPGIAFMSLMVADILIRYLTVAKEKFNYNTYKVLIASIILIGFLPPLINYTLFPEGVQTPEYSVKSLFHEKLVEKADPISQATKFIKENTTQEDRIYVCGTLYDIYPLSRRLPATIALGLIRFEPKDQDPFLAKTYNRIIRDLKTKPPKIILIGCPLYRSIRLETGPWEEVRQLLQENYQKPIRFEWNKRLKFLSGKNKLMENVEEWLDVYILKSSQTKP